MRIRTAKQRAQRIDLSYFRRPTGLRRWRYIASAAVTLAAAIWVAALAASGNRASYSAGPLSSAHALIETRCETCHGAPSVFRRHATDATCVTCHDGPPHAANAPAAPACAACHQEHQGRVRLVQTDDRFCIQCHGQLTTTTGEPGVARSVGTFPGRHPEFAAVQAATDPGGLRFNHALHLKVDLRGPAGPETLLCQACHRPASPRGPLMSTVTYQQECARCHPLFFDERIAQQAPHGAPAVVRAQVQQALTAYARQNPAEITKADADVRRVPLNFPRPAEAPARNADEWVARRTAADERILWNKTCAECHETTSPVAEGTLPQYAASNLKKGWMPRARFNHTPHMMVKCQGCHAAEGSTRRADLLLPSVTVCASCHAPPPGASGRVESRCVECHRYHDWTKSRPVTPSFSPTDFK